MSVVQRQQAIDGLRDLASWIEAHPDANIQVTGAIVTERVGSKGELDRRLAGESGEWTEDHKAHSCRAARQFGPSKCVLSAPWTEINEVAA